MLIPTANQIILRGGYGSTNRTGWNVAGLIDCDRIAGNSIFDFIQGSDNTNGCGCSVQ